MRTPDDLADTPIWFRVLLIVSLLSGAGGGVVGLTQTDDRYRGSDAKADFAARDDRIARLEVRIYQLEDTTGQHLQHSARYTERIETDRRQINELKVELHKHMERSSH